MKAKRVVDALSKGEQEAALDLLSSNRSLTWVRDDKTGAYPLHIAASKAGFLSPNPNTPSLFPLHTCTGLIAAAHCLTLKQTLG